MKPALSLPSKRGKDAKKRALLYFVCGNPGIVEFYADFFSCLRAQLDKSEHDTAYDIYGRNLLGFHDDDHEPFGPGNEPFDLEGQVEGIWADVAARKTDAGKPYDFVILMGHSVGAYIAVEVFHRQSKSPKPDLHLQNGFLLFPTLTWIQKSPSGRRVMPIQFLPTLEVNLHRIAKVLLFFLSTSTLQYVWERFMGFSHQSATSLAEWLKSRDGVWQAIHLGQCELRTILEEKWEDELWHAAVPENGDGDKGQDVTPKFFMFYGKHDHWVANHLRDEFIQKRQESDHPGQPRIAIDEGDIPHAFCTREGMCK
jgi:hypothetical protein